VKPRILPLALAVALVASSGPSSPAESDDELLARAANYAKVFFARFSSVVAEERYHDHPQEDERLQIAVPVEMRESFVRGGLTCTGKATYGRFWRFGVETRESVEPPEKVR
jgi:hypothetical protein